MPYSSDKAIVTKSLLRSCPQPLKCDPILFGSTVKICVSEVQFQSLPFPMERLSNSLSVDENQLIQVGMASTEVDVQIDSCLMSMKPTEQSLFSIRQKIHPKLNGLGSEDEELEIEWTITIEMREVLNAQPMTHWHAETHFEVASVLRSSGVEAFKAGRRLDAFRLFKMALTLASLALSPLETLPKDVKENLEALKVSCQSNLSACHFAWLHNPRAIVHLSDQVLAQDPASVKHLYRRGVAHLRMKDFQSAKRDFVLAHSLEPANRLVNQKLAECKVEENKQQRNLAKGLQKMFRNGNVN